MLGKMLKSVVDIETTIDRLTNLFILIQKVMIK